MSVCLPLCSLDSAIRRELLLSREGTHLLCLSVCLCMLFIARCSSASLSEWTSILSSSFSVWQKKQKKKRWTRSQISETMKTTSNLCVLWKLFLQLASSGSGNIAKKRKRFLSSIFFTLNDNNNNNNNWDDYSWQKKRPGIYFVVGFQRQSSEIIINMVVVH